MRFTVILSIPTHKVEQLYPPPPSHPISQAGLDGGKLSSLGGSIFLSLDFIQTTNNIVQHTRALLTYVYAEVN